MDLLILGASIRAAAFSALRAGLVPFGIDLFADRDLADVAQVIRIAPDRYPNDFPTLARSAPPGPWIYTGGLENHPDLIDAIAADRPLLGNPGATLRAVRDPFAVATSLRAARLPHPAVRRTPEGLPRDGSWLVKPLASAGGQGIRPLGPLEGQPRRPVYYQERIPGPSHSALFVGHRDGAVLAGLTRQWVGRPGADFGYIGSLGPWPVAPRQRERIETLGHRLARSFGLLGLFGIDFILQGGHPWPVEINPRYTAAVEVLELALGLPLLSAHVAACRSESLESASPQAHNVRVVGKVILFAPARVRFPALDLPAARADDPFVIPRYGDVPQPGTLFEPGEPVMTLFASGPNPALCRARLVARRARWLSRLTGAITGS